MGSQSGGDRRFRSTRRSSRSPDPGSDASIHMRRIVPVHRATEGLPARALRELVHSTLALLTPAAAPNLIPASLDDLPRAEALRQIHFPDSWGALEQARRHLVLTEFFGMQLAIAAQHEAQRAEPGEKHAGSGELMRRCTHGSRSRSPRRRIA